MTLRESEDKRIKEAIGNFHEDVKVMGIEAAKRLTLDNTCYKPIIDYVKNYK